MKITCPDCAKEIPLADTNVSTNIALCRACEQTFSFTDLNEVPGEPAFDLTKPPRGTWVRETANGFEVGSTMRSSLASGLVFFAVFCLCIIYFIILHPEKFLGRMDSKLHGFEFPVFCISSMALLAALVATFGKIIIRRDGEEGSVSMGFGPLRYIRRFRWSEIKRVQMALTTYTQNDQRLPVIELEREETPIRFGSQITEPRRKFLHSILKHLHTAKR